MYALWVGSVATCCLAPSALAQTGNVGAIRVESNEVLLPVLVLDKRRLDEIRGMDVLEFLKEASAPNSPLLEGIAVRGLSAADFQVFEDGMEQKIERITLVTGPAPEETSGAGEGKWERVGTDLPANWHVIWLPHWPQYLIAYLRSTSEDRNCHQIIVKVNRPDSLVYSRGGYCDEKYSMADPLKGTKLGGQMEAEMNPGKAGKIRLSLAVFTSFSGTNAVATEVVLGFTVKSRPEDCAGSDQIGILGMVYARDGTLVRRFSDLSTVGFHFHGDPLPFLEPMPPAGVPCRWYNLPDQYETRIDLAPGEYDLKVAFRDGKRFGRAETGIHVESHDGQHLTTSSVILSRKYRKVSDESHSGLARREGYQPLVSRGFEVIPTLDTRFKKGDPLDFYFEIYDPQQPQRPPGTIKALLRILDLKTGQVAKQLDPVDAAPYAKPDDPVIRIGGGIDISGLSKGFYTLEAQATDSAGDSTPWRAVNFSIE